MSTDEIALRIFCALLQSGTKISVLTNVARQQVEIAFAMAETFVKVAADRKP